MATVARRAEHAAIPWAAAVAVYGGGFVIGLTLVSFPASSAFMKATHGFTDAQYGAIYLPQLIAAIAGAVGGGWAAQRIGLKRMFVTALIAFAAAQALLALSADLSTSRALVAIMAGTACFGFGFGFGGGPLNAFAVLLFPRRSTSALTALHMCAGAGLTVAPFYFAALAGAGHWQAGPETLLAVTAALTMLTLTARFPAMPTEPTGRVAGPTPGRSGFFWTCAAISVLYSVAEGVFSNWAVIYVGDERGLPASTAAFALTAFWASITGGRLIASLLGARVTPGTILRALPVAMALVLLLLARLDSGPALIVGFAAAGLACSAFFPMLVAFAAGPFPARVSWIASMLTAAMMVGVGLGSYGIGALKGGGSIAGLYQVAIVAPLVALVLVMLARRPR
jgi:fucose permease